MVDALTALAVVGARGVPNVRKSARRGTQLPCDHRRFGLTRVEEAGRDVHPVRDEVSCSDLPVR
jgi:hypothetical protein